MSPMQDNLLAHSATQARDPEARIERLYLELVKPMTNVLFRVLWNREEVQDVIQETFVRLWRMRARVDWSRPGPLAYRIAMNLAINRRRSRRLWRWIPFDQHPDVSAPAAASPERIYEDTERGRAFRRAVDALPDKLRQALLMCVFSGLTQEEIGAALGLPAGTVASRRNTAVKRLKKNLEDKP